MPSTSTTTVLTVVGALAFVVGFVGYVAPPSGRTSGAGDPPRRTPRRSPSPHSMASSSVALANVSAPATQSSHSVNSDSAWVMPSTLGTNTIPASVTRAM